MTRVRVALALLILALAVPIALLVARALESVELERQVRHQAVAERVFDEMERMLSQFLQEEEARPAADYRFYSALDERDTGRTRSPLSNLPDRDFVLGYFQIDPDGGFTTPLRPVDEMTAERAGDWPPPGTLDLRTRRAIDELELRVAPFWREARAKSLARSLGSELQEEIPASAKSPLDMREEKAAADATSKAAAHDRAATVKKSVTAYEALQSLNRGAEQRQGRKQIVLEADRPRRLAANEPEPDPGSFGMAEMEADAEAKEEYAYSRRDDSDAPSSSGERYTLFGGSRSEGRVVSPSITALLAPKAAPPARDRVRIILEPMAGQPLGSRQLMLYRTVLVGQRGYRQGLLLDEEALGAWLEQSVVAGSNLASSIRLRFGDDAAGSAPPSGQYVYPHTFAEPFDALQLRLDVAPLRGMGSNASIYALAALLCVVGLAGVAAVYRMISVVVQFAERRNNFVAAVSHELKTPLTSIRMYAEMLRDGVVLSEEKRHDYYRTISDESERLSRLIENVLEFSRVEKGNREFSLTVGSLGEVVAELARTLTPHVERHGFTLEVCVDDDIPPVRFDRDAVVQMVFNLVDNAIKYAAGAERRSITLECCRTPEGGASISIRDFGPGVPRKHQSRVFEPFFRLEQELTRTTKGSGIGLALVKELGEAMGASVRGANADGGGFRVSVAFEPAR